MEFKVQRGVKPDAVTLVDIGTEWNLKCFTDSGRVTASGGRYRNRVEFKVFGRQAVRNLYEVDIGTEWNLKVQGDGRGRHWRLCRYRNRVEFKGRF